MSPTRSSPYDEATDRTERATAPAAPGSESREAEERARFVKAALSFIGTPYHHCGRIKGAGVDCATLLICAAEEAGIPLDFKPPDYSPHWHLHRGAQLYLHTISKICKPVEPPARPGDIAIWRFGRSFSHGAIVVDWPRIVHACIGHAVREDDVDHCQWLTQVGEQGPGHGKPRPMMLVSYWPR